MYLLFDHLNSRGALEEICCRLQPRLLRSLVNVRGMTTTVAYAHDVQYCRAQQHPTRLRKDMPKRWWCPPEKRFLACRAAIESLRYESRELFRDARKRIRRFGRSSMVHDLETLTSNALAVVGFQRVLAEDGWQGERTDRSIVTSLRGSQLTQSPSCRAPSTYGTAPQMADVTTCNRTARVLRTRRLAIALGSAAHSAIRRAMAGADTRLETSLISAIIDARRGSKHPSRQSGAAGEAGAGRRKRLEAANVVSGRAELKALMRGRARGYDSTG